MTRVPRLYLPDGNAHVFSRGNRFEEIFVTEGDAYGFLFRAAENFGRFELACGAYCLMPTHFHFVLRGRREALSSAMHRLIGGYARWFNRRHGYRGHLFGDRFGAREILDEAHFLEVVRYVVLNPVRAGLCSHPRAWRWSSYNATVGLKPKPDFLDLSWMDGLITPAGFAAHAEAGMAALDIAA